jgi:hypothetical protein
MVPLEVHGSISKPSRVQPLKVIAAAIIARPAVGSLSVKPMFLVLAIVGVRNVPTLVGVRNGSKAEFALLRRSQLLSGMPTDQDQTLETIGLGGDGDEVDAIAAVERHFGVNLHYEDAAGWETAGHVFASLLSALPADKREEPGLWPTFATILCGETGADPSRAGPDTLLLALPLRLVIRRWFNLPFG